MAIWDDVIPERDKEIYLRNGLGRRVGFGEKPAVLVVDVSKNFCDQSYPYATPAKMVSEMVAGIKQILAKARPAGIPIFYATGSPQTLPVLAGRTKGVFQHPKMHDPTGFEIVDEIAPQDGDVLLVKNKSSMFFGTPLLAYLNYHNVDTLIITGQATSGCLRATVVDAFAYNFRNIVPEECVADAAEVPHKVNLFDIAMKYADVIPLREVLDYLNRFSDPTQRRSCATDSNPV